MKHEVDFQVEYLSQRALPDAPLAMHKQVLERPLPWLAFARLWLLPRLRRG
jgi:hypothetical protein